MKIDNILLDKLTAQAQASPRLRMNLDLRNSDADSSQRMLNAILPNAVLREKKAIKWGTKNQKGFSSMLIMEYYCPAIGLVRLTVGQKRNDGAKVQYCITAIEVP